MKKCIQCCEYKDTTHFSKRSISPDGLQPKCKECNKTDNAKFREIKPDYKKVWDKNNPGAQVEITKRYFRRNPEKLRSIMKKYYSKMGMGIYKVTCDITQDFYIGYSSQIQARYNAYLTGAVNNAPINRNLLNAMIEYGKENFTFEIIEQVYDKSLLEQREIYWIKKLNPPYNIKK